MQDFGIFCDRPIDVARPEGSRTVHVTFRGTRDAAHVADKDTRFRVALPSVRAVELRRQLAGVVPESERLDWRPELLEILESHRGDTGADENAVEILQRLSRAWRESHL